MHPEEEVKVRDWLLPFSHEPAEKLEVQEKGVRPPTPWEPVAKCIKLEGSTSHAGSALAFTSGERETALF